MDTRFTSDNLHLEGPGRFTDLDPDLSRLKSLPYVYTYPELLDLPVETPGIYTLCGGHHIGKTTLLKQWVDKLLHHGIAPNAIAFIASESLANYHELANVVKKQILAMPTDSLVYLILDNVTSLRDWIKALTPLAQEGLFDRVVMMLSGTHSSLPLLVRNVFPAASSSATQMDFHLYPLSFRETIILKHDAMPSIEVIYEDFNHYQIHGGHLHVINEMALHGTLSDKTLYAYAEWIGKEIVKCGKQERYLRELLNAIMKHYNKQVTWNGLAQELTIDHPKTIGDYFAFLESLNVLFVQYALVEETLTPAPKKARKLMFTDPFILHAVRAYLTSTKHYESHIKTLQEDTDFYSRLVASIVITQYYRYYPTYYIKGEGEVDLAYVYHNRFWPIETTWTSQIRSKDIKQILKYGNCRILTKTERSGIIEHVRTEPLPLALLQLDAPSKRY